MMNEIVHDDELLEPLVASCSSAFCFLFAVPPFTWSGGKQTIILRDFSEARKRVAWLITELSSGYLAAVMVLPLFFCTGAVGGIKYVYVRPVTCQPGTWQRLFFPFYDVLFPARFSVDLAAAGWMDKETSQFITLNLLNNKKGHKVWWKFYRKDTDGYKPTAFFSCTKTESTITHSKSQIKLIAFPE